MILLVIGEAGRVVRLLPYLAGCFVLGQLETGRLSTDLQLCLQVLKLLLILFHAPEGGRLLLLEARSVAGLILFLDGDLAVVFAGFKKMECVRGVDLGTQPFCGQLFDNGRLFPGDWETRALIQLVRIRSIRAITVGVCLSVMLLLEWIVDFVVFLEHEGLGGNRFALSYLMLTQRRLRVGCNDLRFRLALRQFTSVFPICVRSLSLRSRANH